MKRNTICLCMIVKNESRVIRRCLDSVIPFISHWIIVDTGSTDGTQDIVRSALAGLPGELHERPWKDFGHNRTEALELARDKAEYTLIIDADEVLLHAPGFQLPALTADVYMTVHQAGESGTSFYLAQIVRSALPFRYVGVLHEVIMCDAPHSKEKLDGLACKGFFDSARNADPKAKYRSDAQVLERALEREPDNARYVFYLAQSYRDAGELAPAITNYRRRAVMGGWDEEIWYSLYQIAVLTERQGGPFAAALEAYLDAYQARPSRAEPLCELARYYRLQGRHALSYLFASRAAVMQRPADILFLDDSVYNWRALDELSIAAYYVGRLDESRVTAERLLSEGKLPAGERPRVEKNLAFANNLLDTTARRDRNKAKQQRKGKR